MGKPSGGFRLPGFSLIAPSIYLHDNDLRTRPYAPSIAASSFYSTTETPAMSAPDMIVMTTWTGANPRHIAKYTKGYQDLYPGVPIMVIITVIADLAFRSTREKMDTLAPVVTYLCPDIKMRKPGSVRPVYSNLLLHAFSEGGSNKAVCLARAYLERTGARLPVGAFVFDSTPGTPRYSCNVAAFKRSLPRNPVVRVLGYPFGAFVLAVTWILFTLFVGFENNAISKTRRALNDARLWAVARVPRTYLFSEADDLIYWKDVADHGDEAARSHGVTSLVVRFKKTAHCGHARGHESYYWNAVRRTWEARDVEMAPTGFW